MRKSGTALLQLDPRLNHLSKGKKIRHGLSGTFQANNIEGVRRA